MKKLTALFLAFVLVLSLSAIALAATGNSKITVNVDSTNISVTLPLNITITALVDGGTATVPNDYQIVNNSAIPVMVDTIAVSLKEGANWAFKNAPIIANATPTDASGIKNDIYLSVNGQVLAVQGATAPDNARDEELPWNIDAGATKNLPLVCSTSKLNTTATVENLITITYVVSAGSYTVPQEQ